jgi:hypothetical protein
MSAQSLEQCGIWPVQGLSVRNTYIHIYFSLQLSSKACFFVSVESNCLYIRRVSLQDSISVTETVSVL